MSKNYPKINWYINSYFFPKKWVKASLFFTTLFSSQTMDPISNLGNTAQEFNDEKCLESAAKITNDDFPIAPAGHETLFESCRKILESRQNDSANAALKIALKDYSELVAYYNFVNDQSPEAARLRVQQSERDVNRATESLNFDYRRLEISARKLARAYPNLEFRFIYESSVFDKLNESLNRIDETISDIQKCKKQLAAAKEAYQKIKKRNDGRDIIANLKAEIEANIAFTERKVNDN
ncbi:hypothetical protein BX667DRAFT_521114 [Coemansia mojavensis]|nr:hypothetical protein BX667DRAFT_521114 [Coemansia mojavensis]